MPTNKNAQLRYKVLDRCFGDWDRLYSLEDLLDCVNEKMTEMGCGKVTDRTIKADIKFMRDSDGFNAPIRTYKICDSYRGIVWCYRYDTPDFSIFNNELSEKDVADLQSVIDMLGRYRGIPAYQWVDEVISNLKYRFGLNTKNECLISFDQNENIQGLQYLADIIDATMRHKVLNVTFKPFTENEPMKLVIHPYFIKQWNQRWFLFGFNHEAGMIWNLPLDRITGRVTVNNNVQFIPNVNVDFNKFFDDVIGVSFIESAEIGEIKLKFSEKRFPYVVTKPLHKSQKIIDADNHIISIKVKWNTELDQMILAFGPDVEVLEPQWYRDYFKDKISENYKIYFEVGR